MFSIGDIVTVTTSGSMWEGEWIITRRDKGVYEWRVELIDGKPSDFSYADNDELALVNPGSFEFDV